MTSTAVAAGSATAAIRSSALHGLRLHRAPSPAWLLAQFGEARAILEPLFGRWPSEPIDVVYPDTSPARLAFVEPAAGLHARPRLRLQDDDPRLRGVDGWPAVIVPHELAHAVHFAAVPIRVRLRIEARYAAWLAGRILVHRLPPVHGTADPSSPLVAWLESFGLLAERYWLYARRHDRGGRRAGSPRYDPAELGPAFVRDELSDQPSLARDLRGYVGVTRLPERHSATADATEGAVYRDVFLSPERPTTLTESVASYFDATADGALNINDYRQWLLRN
ncbi:MAG: hypothetical protein ACH36H_09075 [Candidatus Nanopelagicales bacterium]